MNLQLDGVASIIKTFSAASRHPSRLINTSRAFCTRQSYFRGGTEYIINEFSTFKDASCGIEGRGESISIHMSFHEFKEVMVHIVVCHLQTLVVPLMAQNLAKPFLNLLSESIANQKEKCRVIYEPLRAIFGLFTVSYQSRISNSSKPQLCKA